MPNPTGLENYSGKEAFLLILFHYLFLFLFIYLVIYSVGIEPSVILRTFIGILYQLSMIDCDDLEAIDGISEWQGKPKYSVKPAPVLLYPAQIRNDFIGFKPG
jgi:hypothetical protein